MMNDRPVDIRKSPDGYYWARKKIEGHITMFQKTGCLLYSMGCEYCDDMEMSVVDEYDFIGPIICPPIYFFDRKVKP